jgi:hypothetical protein
MPTRLDSVVIDTPNPVGLAAWWSLALGWAPPEPDPAGDPDEVVVRPRDGEPGLDLVFGRASDVVRIKNRVHLDLASQSLRDQCDLGERLRAAGARQVDIGQGDVPWIVLADPDGNEFCVLEPRDRYRAAGSVAAIVVDAEDPPSLAQFWATATGWRVTDSGPAGAALHPTADPNGSARAAGPYLEFVPVPEPHLVKNRLHLDVRPEPGSDQPVEVARLIGLGARRIEIGQSSAPAGEVSWVVLADPERNEFCVLRTPASA